jgi:hypothetical protein
MPDILISIGAESEAGYSVRSVRISLTVTVEVRRLSMPERNTNTEEDCGRRSGQ